MEEGGQKRALGVGRPFPVQPLWSILPSPALQGWPPDAKGPASASPPNLSFPTLEIGETGDPGGSPDQEKSSNSQRQAHPALQPE